MYVTKQHEGPPAKTSFSLDWDSSRLMMIWLLLLRSSAIGSIQRKTQVEGEGMSLKM